MNVAQMQVLWAAQLLPAIPRPLTVNNMVSVVAWAIAEGGWFENDATYNVLDTDQVMPGSIGVVTTGPGMAVQAYTSEDEGIAATLITLENGYYAGILACLAADAPPPDTIAAIGDSPWGTLPVSLQGALYPAQAAVAMYWRRPGLAMTQERDVYFSWDNKTYFGITRGVAVEVKGASLTALNNAVANGQALVLPDDQATLYNFFVLGDKA